MKDSPNIPTQSPTKCNCNWTFIKAPHDDSESLPNQGLAHSNEQNRLEAFTEQRTRKTEELKMIVPGRGANISKTSRLSSGPALVGAQPVKLKPEFSALYPFDYHAQQGIRSVC